MMDDVGLHDYRFRSTWLVPGGPEEVFRALRDVEDYPNWWPQVVRAERCDDDTTPGAAEAYDMVVRSLLPYDLAFRSATTRDDPAAGVLEARLTGDLDGFSRWTVRASGDEAVLVFEEEVHARKALLRRLALVARPAFVANHALMMRAGRRGLRAYLAGRRRA